MPFAVQRQIQPRRRQPAALVRIPQRRCALRRPSCRPTSDSDARHAAARRPGQLRAARAARPSRRAERGPTCPRATPPPAAPSRPPRASRTSVLRTSSASPTQQVGAHLQHAVERACPRTAATRRRQQRARGEPRCSHRGVELQARRASRPPPAGRPPATRATGGRRGTRPACGSAATWKPRLRASISRAARRRSRAPRPSIAMRSNGWREVQAHVGARSPPTRRRCPGRGSPRWR